MDCVFFSFSMQWKHVKTLDEQNYWLKKKMTCLKKSKSLTRPNYLFEKLLL